MASTDETHEVAETSARKSRRLIQLGFILMGLAVIAAVLGEVPMGAAAAFFGWTFLLPGLIGWTVNDSPPKG